MTDITIFSHESCEACDKAKSYFNEKNIQFKEQPIAESKEALDLFAGEPTVKTPVIKICKEEQSCKMIIGFNQEEIEKEL